MYIIGFKGIDTENRVKKLENSFLKQGKIDKEELFDGDICIKVISDYGLTLELLNLIGEIKNTTKEIQNYISDFIKSINLKILPDFDINNLISKFIPIKIYNKITNELIQNILFIYDHEIIDDVILEFVKKQINYEFIDNHDYHFMELLEEKMDVIKKWIKINDISIYQNNEWKIHVIDLCFDNVC